MVWVIIIERQENITFDKGDMQGSGIPSQPGGQREENCRREEGRNFKLYKHLLSDIVLDNVKDSAT